MHPRSRLPVATVVAMAADGMTTDEIIADFPELESEGIRVALLYAAEAVRSGSDDDRVLVSADPDFGLQA